MSTIIRMSVLLATFMVLAVACGGGDGSIEIESARYRVASPTLGASYMTITNTTDSDVTLEAASAEGVGRIEIHESFATEDGAMTMQELSNGITIAAGQSVTLEPGGMHLMIFDPEGTDDLTITLDFGDQTIEVLAPYDAEASAAATDSTMDDDAMAEMDDATMDDDTMPDTDG